MEEYILIVLQLGIIGLGSYLIHYSREKGKNQASKEDLKKITQSVESVKHLYAEEVERLKASLSQSTNKKNVLFNEEKEAIVQFFSQLNGWIWDGLNINVTDYYNSNHLEINSALIKMQEQYNQTNVSFSKVQLLVKDNNLIQVGHEAIMNTLKLHQFMTSKYSSLRIELAIEHGQIEKILSGELDFNGMSNESRSIYQTQAEQRSKKIDDLRKEIINDKKTHFDPAISKRNEFKDLGKIYLNEITNEA